MGLIYSSIKETFNDFVRESSISYSMYCVKPTSVWKLETSEKMRKKKKIGYGVIHGAHISLFGGEGSFLPPPCAHLKTWLIIHCASDFNSELIKRINTRLMRYVWTVHYTTVRLWN